MPKIPRSGRWFLFSLEYSEKVYKSIPKYLQKINPGAAQWLAVDTLVEGYLYFSTPRAIPTKKLWLPGAQFSLVTSAQLKLHFKATPVESFQSFGTNLLFVIEEVIDLGPNYCPTFDDSPSPSPVTPVYKAYDITFSCFTIPKYVVQYTLTDPSGAADYLESLTQTQRDSLPRYLDTITDNYQMYQIALIQSQINNNS